MGDSQLPRGREEAIGGDRGRGEINPQEAGGRVSGKEAESLEDEGAACPE